MRFLLSLGRDRRGKPSFYGDYEMECLGSVKSIPSSVVPPEVPAGACVSDWRPALTLAVPFVDQKGSAVALKSAWELLQRTPGVPSCDVGTPYRMAVGSPPSLFDAVNVSFKGAKGEILGEVLGVLKKEGLRPEARSLASGRLICVLDAV